MSCYCCYCAHNTLPTLQVRSLLSAVRPDRQTLLFSATLPRKVQGLVTEALTDAVRISVGTLGAANADVAQRVEVLSGADSCVSVCVTC